MIRIAFCDDNIQYITLLSDYVEKECNKILGGAEDFIVAPPFAKGTELLEYLKSNPIDIVFLDIDMPDVSGFEVAKVLTEQYSKIKIVFVSAYDNFVYNSFEFYPAAYLRKEHILEDLSKVLLRLIDKIHEPSRQVKLLTNVGTKVVDTNTITYIETNHNYYIVHLVYGTQYNCRGTLSEIECTLSKFNFYRIHSAYLVNLEYVDRMVDKKYIIINDIRLPIAQRRSMEFKKLYMDYLRRKLDS